MNQGAEWGVSLWKQDWLASIFELMVGPSEDVYTARAVHLQMAAAAISAGLVMEYCMPVVRLSGSLVPHPLAAMWLPKDMRNTPSLSHAASRSATCWNPLRTRRHASFVSLMTTAPTLPSGALGDPVWWPGLSG